MTKCQKCGKNISDFADICPNCGYENSIQPNNVVNVKRNRTKLPVRLIMKIVVCFAICVMVASAFVLACALNAYNAIIGKSVLGLGAIFFEHSVINHTMQPIVISAVCAGMISLVATVVVAICLISIFRNKIKK